MTLRAPAPLTVGDLQDWLATLHPGTRVEILDRDGLDLPVMNVVGNQGEGGNYLRFEVWVDGPRDLEGRKYR